MSVMFIILFFFFLLSHKVLISAPPHQAGALSFHQDSTYCPSHHKSFRTQPLTSLLHAMAVHTLDMKFKTPGLFEQTTKTKKHNLVKNMRDNKTSCPLCCPLCGSFVCVCVPE